MANNLYTAVTTRKNVQNDYNEKHTYNPHKKASQDLTKN